MQISTPAFDDYFSYEGRSLSCAGDPAAWTSNTWRYGTGDIPPPAVLLTGCDLKEDCDVISTKGQIWQINFNSSMNLYISKSTCGDHSAATVVSGSLYKKEN